MAALFLVFVVRVVITNKDVPLYATMVIGVMEQTKQAVKQMEDGVLRRQVVKKVRYFGILCFPNF